MNDLLKNKKTNFNEALIKQCETNYTEILEILSNYDNYINDVSKEAICLSLNCISNLLKLIESQPGSKYYYMTCIISFFYLEKDYMGCEFEPSNHIDVYGCLSEEAELILKSKIMDLRKIENTLMHKVMTIN